MFPKVLGMFCLLDSKKKTGNFLNLPFQESNTAKGKPLQIDIQIGIHQTKYLSTSKNQVQWGGLFETECSPYLNRDQRTRESLMSLMRDSALARQLLRMPICGYLANKEPAKKEPTFVFKP